MNLLTVGCTNREEVLYVCPICTVVEKLIVMLNMIYLTSYSHYLGGSFILSYDKHNYIHWNRFIGVCPRRSKTNFKAALKALD